MACTWKVEENIEVDHRFYWIYMEIKHLGVSLSIRRFWGKGGREKQKKERAKGEKENSSSSPCFRTKKGEKITPVLQGRGVLPTLPSFGNFCRAMLFPSVQTHPAITFSGREELGPTNSKMASVEDIRTRVTLQEHGVINVSWLPFISCYW